MGYRIEQGPRGPRRLARVDGGGSEGSGPRCGPRRRPGPRREAPGPPVVVSDSRPLAPKPAVEAAAEAAKPAPVVAAAPPAPSSPSARRRPRPRSSPSGCCSRPSAPSSPTRQRPSSRWRRLPPPPPRSRPRPSRPRPSQPSRRWPRHQPSPPRRSARPRPSRSWWPRPPTAAPLPSPFVGQARPGAPTAPRAPAAAAPTARSSSRSTSRTPTSEPAPHPGRRERAQHRRGRGRQGQAVGLAPQRDLGAGARHDPRGASGLQQGREGRRDPHRLARPARQGARGAGPRRGRQAQAPRSTTRTKMAEAQLKEAEVETRRFAAEARRGGGAVARGPLREETIRLSYADPDEVAKTLQGILGIPPEGTASRSPTRAVAGPSRPADSSRSRPSAGTVNRARRCRSRTASLRLRHGPAMVSVSQDVLAKGLTIRAHKPTNTHLPPPLRRGSGAHQEAGARAARRAAAPGEDRGADGDPRPQRARGHRHPVGRRGRDQSGVDHRGRPGLPVAPGVSRADAPVAAACSSPTAHGARQPEPGQRSARSTSRCAVCPASTGSPAATGRQPRQPADSSAAQRGGVIPAAASRSASSARTGTSTSRCRRSPARARRARWPVPRS